MVQVKVCGLRDADRVRQACEQGASLTGFVFFPPSPRFVPPEQAGELATLLPATVKSVGVFVDPTDAFIDHVLSWVPLDVLQLHGHEDDARVRALAERSGCSVMKALRVESAADVEEALQFPSADMILFDAKPPRDAAWPGGHGLPFDWRLLREVRLDQPWALAGGLNAGNLAAAIELVDPPIVDVSSGVEQAPGEKDPALLADFLAHAARLSSSAPFFQTADKATAR